jgi:hypothetical protein
METCSLGSGAEEGIKILPAYSTLEEELLKNPHGCRIFKEGGECGREGGRIRRKGGIEKAVKKEIEEGKLGVARELRRKRLRGRTVAKKKEDPQPSFPVQGFLIGFRGELLKLGDRLFYILGMEREGKEGKNRGRKQDPEKREKVNGNHPIQRSPL